MRLALTRTKEELQELENLELNNKFNFPQQVLANLANKKVTEEVFKKFLKEITTPDFLNDGNKIFNVLHNLIKNEEKKIDTEEKKTKSK